MYGGFKDLFDDLPFSLLANITCVLRFKSETPMNVPLKGNEEWRASIAPITFTPYHSVVIEPPSTTGSGMKSSTGEMDKMSHALANIMLRKK